MSMATIKEIQQLAENARDALWQAAAQYQIQPKVFLHWTAGRYTQDFGDYHICIQGPTVNDRTGEVISYDTDGQIDVMCNDFTKKLSHTWCRNTGSVGIALDCCYGASTVNLGDYAPTAKQIETMAQVVAAVCKGLNIPIDNWHVMTHGEAAANEDGYTSHLRYATWCDDYGDGDTRWDLEFLGDGESPVYDPFREQGYKRGGDVLRGKALWYLNRMD